MLLRDRGPTEAEQKTATDMRALFELCRQLQAEIERDRDALTAARDAQKSMLALIERVTTQLDWRLQKLERAMDMIVKGGER